MKPTDLLKEEHHGVQLSLRVLEKLCEKFSDERDADKSAYAGDLARLIDFFRVFVDKCHHAKEEEILFPALIEAGLPKEGGPVQVMLQEHELGRKLVSELDMGLHNFQTTQKKDLDDLIGPAKNYIQLLTAHIDKEDNVLYPLADAKLPGTLQTEMIEAFEKIEIDRIGQGRHEQFHTMLKEFYHKYLK